MRIYILTGMFQRIERLRKNAFGSMCVFGEDNNNTIIGVWFWKGHELAFPVCFFFAIFCSLYRTRIRLIFKVMTK